MAVTVEMFKAGGERLSKLHCACAVDAVASRSETGAMMETAGRRRETMREADMIETP